MKIFKRRILGRCAASLLALMMVCTWAGCKETAREVNVNELADSLKTQGTFDDELNELKTEMLTPLFSVDTALIASQKSYINSGVTAEAIVVVECKDADGAAKVEAAFKNYVKANADMYRSYNPTEADKLDKAVVQIIGDKYVVLCISGDSNKAKEIIEK